MKSDEIIEFYEEGIKPHANEHIPEFVVFSYLFPEIKNHLAVFFCKKNIESGKMLCGGHISISGISALELIKTAEYFQENGCNIIFDLSHRELT